MKRYLLFEGLEFYPAGGWGDCGGSFDTIEDAESARVEWSDWYHIVDTESGDIVKPL